MSPKMYIILLEQFFVLLVSLRFIDAKSFSNSNEGVEYLPANELQKEFIAAEVCSGFDSFFNYSNDALKKCIEHFGWQLDADQGMPVQERCRRPSGSSKSGRVTVTLEVPSSDYYQIVLLIEEPNLDDGDLSKVNYNIVNNNTKFTDGLVISEGKNYTIYFTQLDKDFTPLLWRREGSIYGGKLPENRRYDVQVNWNLTIDSIDAWLTWNQTGKLDACFELKVSCLDNPISNIRPDSPQSVLIKNLPPNSSCDVKLRGLYGTTNFSINTPAYKVPDDLDDFPVEVPHNETVPEDESGKPSAVKNIELNAEEDGDKWKVHVWWTPPPVLPEKYNVTLWGHNNLSVIVPGNATEAELRGVVGTGYYDVSVYPVRGGKAAHNSARSQFPSRTLQGATGGVLRWAVAAGVAWVAAALAAALYWARSCRANIMPQVKPKLIIDGKSKEMPQEEQLQEPPPAADAWEIKPERLMLGEVIGEGAFGIVRRGTLGPTGKKVAVKMLKDFPSLDEMRAFYLEMELMKSVGAHPHVVSLVGCCSTGQPAIVAEYCSRGDLLNFLRCSWDVMVSKRNANYYNNNINTSDYRNDLFKCTPEEHSRLVVNKMYDLQGVCDTDLTSLDLLSFCRQIAMGMEFLSLNKVVHRDLAARNILVTADKTLKIADFGLSRDVYRENQYKQTGNGKMPVKWMALESLTRRIYTTQSDVWSFGVVVWEVVTVGGAPYSGVEATRLPRLLRAGYRMPCPPNCSYHLYELMRSCWAVRPRDRPTFAELHTRLDELLNSASADEYLSLELDEEPPPAPTQHRYIRMILRAKRNWTRGESYERPLKAPHNHYSTPPVSVTYKTPV